MNMRKEKKRTRYKETTMLNEKRVERNEDERRGNLLKKWGDDGLKDKRIVKKSDDKIIK